MTGPATQVEMDLERHLWAIAADLRGLGSPADFAPRIVGLLALRKLLAQAAADTAAAQTFADLLGTRDLERTLGDLLRASARPTAAGDILDHIRALLGPLRADEHRWVAVAIQGIAAIPDTLLERPEAGRAALRLVASTAGKSSDVLVPSPAVANLMVDLSDPAAGSRIADPHCGTGTMLLAAAEWAREHSRALAALAGSDPSAQTAALARAILFLAGLPAEIEVANAIVAPGRRVVGPHEVVLSAPSIGMRPPPHLHIEASDRYRYGLPTRQADWLYVQHALSLVGEHGVAVVLVPIGSLFRSGAEQEIRRALIASEQIDAVVGLPGGLLTGTALACALLVLRRNRPPARREIIVMVEVSDAGRGDRRGDLQAGACAAVVQAVRDGGDGLTGQVQVRRVSKAELAASGHSLLPSRYIDGLPKSPARAIGDIVRELHNAVARDAEAATELAEAFAALVAASPPSPNGMTSP